MGNKYDSAGQKRKSACNKYNSVGHKRKSACNEYNSAGHKRKKYEFAEHKHNSACKTA